MIGENVTVLALRQEQLRVRRFFIKWDNSQEASPSGKPEMDGWFQ